MKKPLSHFDNLENLIKFSYSNFGNSLQLYTREFNLDSPLGYCYKYSYNGVTIYTVVHTPINRPHTDRRIIAHEYGHITLGHLSGVHEELDSRVLWTIENQRAELIKGINKNLGIDYADKLLNRVIDDPQLNHSLHNIAMDFEVNQQVLSKEDIEEMEEDITSHHFEADPRMKALKEKYNSLDPDSPDIPEEDRDLMKKVKEELGKHLASSKIKLMLPSRYHLPDNSPFPEDLTYPEYLILIIKNLDQFVKMLISIKKGGSGDTSEVTDQDIQESLNGSGDGGMQSLDDLLDSCGMGDKNQGTGSSQDGNDSGDHGTESRKQADEKRSSGGIKPDPGCGSSGGPNDIINPSEFSKDPIDLAIEEVISNFSQKVCSFEIKKDMTYLYNRGINRTVLCPTYHTKVKLTTNPKIVFLIDVSGSMDRNLVSRVLHQISLNMANIKKGLKYDIISWSTYLGDHIRDIDPNSEVPSLHVGGGTTMAKGIDYFKNNYDNDSILVLISDFDDRLSDWEEVTSSMPDYDIYGFCYGYRDCTREIKNMKVRNFKSSYDYY